MNDAHLEDLLRTMQPSQPSAELTQRVDRELALAALFRDAPPAAITKSKRAPWYVPATWATLGAAAAVLVMSALPPATVPTNKGLTTVPSVNTSREWIDVQDGGIKFDQPGSPQRQLNVRAVERRQWVDPRTGVEYTVEVPVNESVTMPVKFQ